MKILRLDASGHTTVVEISPEQIQAEFTKLVKQGYAMFLDDVQIKELPVGKAEAEVLALAPLVGG